MVKLPEYSYLTGLFKTAKNSLYLLAPFAIALLIGVPSEYAWITGPLVYFIKNYYETKTGKKL